MLRFAVSLVLLLNILTANCLDFRSFKEYLRKSDDSSAECLLQKDVFLKSLENKAKWAISMLDATGRIPQALTQGNVYDLGMYDQCLDIYEEADNVVIKGKYCLGGLALPLTDVLESDEAITNTTTTLLISTCVPDACLPSDFFGEYAKDDDCQTKNQNKTLDGGDIAFLVFLAAVLLAMAASTVYDLHLQKHSRASRHKLFLAFSVYTNGKTITVVKGKSGQILFFNGMKVISMFWVVLGHRFESSESVVINQVEFDEWQTKWYAMYVMLFGLAVDTFFYISAVLLSYTFLKSHRRSNKKFNVLLYYVHRYFRLTPAMATLFFFQVTLARRIVSGPYAPPHILTGLLGTSCKKNWWSFFLYIQNYVSSDNMCLVHTWYVDVDMQFILISPLILIPLLRYPKRMVYIGLPLLIIATTIIPMLIVHFYELVLYTEEFDSKYYKFAHVRLSGWLVGIMFGAFMLDYKENEAKYRIKSKLLHLTGWTIVFAVFVAQFLLEQNLIKEPTVVKTMFYYPLQRTIWPICLCWISYACLSGYGGFVDWFLSLPVFQVLSRVTYSTYLIHLSLLALHVNYSRTLPYFTNYEWIRTAIADIVIALVAGVFWALAFEYPGINVEQVIFNRGSRHSKK